MVPIPISIHSALPLEFIVSHCFAHKNNSLDYFCLRRVIIFRFCTPITIKKAPEKGDFFNGAAGENRTHDPTLTKGVLYH